MNVQASNIKLTLAACGFVALASVACKSTYSDYCKARQECEGGNDADIDACIETSRASEDVASAYDCEDSFDKYAECYKAKGSCKSVGNTKFYDLSACGEEAKAYSSCTQAASGRKSSSGTGSSSGSSSASGSGSGSGSGSKS